MFKTIIFAFFYFVITGTALGQSGNNDSVIFEKARYNTLQVYHQFMGNQASLYNGYRYNDYRYLYSSGIPFLDTTVMTRGTVVFNNVFYENVLMMFDVFKEKLIVATPGSYNMVELASDRVAEFTLLNHHFKKFKAQNGKSQIPSGFIEVLFEGVGHSIYKKHIKVQREDLSGRKLIYSMEDRFQYTVQNGNKFYRIKNKRVLLKAYTDNRQELRGFLRKSHFQFKTKTDKQLKEIAAYMETLNAQ